MNGEIPLKEAGAPAELATPEAAVASASASVTTVEPVAEAETEATDGTAKAGDMSSAGLRASLEKVVDPELHMNIVELGLVYKVELINQGSPAPDVEVEMTLTSPGCPYGPAIMGQVPTAIKQDYGDRVGEVNVALTFTPPWDPATMASEDVQFELGIF